jgi:hypothetical protein
LVKTSGRIRAVARFNTLLLKQILLVKVALPVAAEMQGKSSMGLMLSGCADPFIRLAMFVAQKIFCLGPVPDPGYFVGAKQAQNLL